MILALLRFPTLTQTSRNKDQRLEMETTVHNKITKTQINKNTFLTSLVIIVCSSNCFLNCLNPSNYSNLIKTKVANDPQYIILPHKFVLNFIKKAPYIQWQTGIGANLHNFSQFQLLPLPWPMLVTLPPSLSSIPHL